MTAGSRSSVGAARVALLVAVAVAAVVLGIALLGGDDERRPSALVPGQQQRDPFAYDPDREAEFAARAAAGLAQPLYARSPGGAVATAKRVARYRPVVEDVADASDFDPDVVEAIVFLESAGRPDARASDDPKGAVGLTQILAETGANLLDLKVDSRAGARLTRRIARAGRRGDARAVERLRVQRRRVDERYDPVKALQATGRYLDFAREKLGGRDDMAIASYHMGVGNLQRVLAAFGADDDTPYTEVFFDSSPLRNARTWRILAALGDDSSTYLWRVRAAQEIMRLHRDDPRALATRAKRHTAKNSAEEVLRPPASTEVYDEPEAIGAARESGELQSLPPQALSRSGIRIDRRMGELARRVDAKPSLYRALRPEAGALLVYLSRGTRAIAKAEPLILTSTVRDEGYQRMLTRRNIEATRSYSLHTTGYAFDVLRRYRSRAHALAFQFMLDRLQALNVIAWVREPAAIHVTVGPEAEKLLG